MKHVRKTPPEGDAEWLRRHDQPNGPLQGTETELEWKERTTPPVGADVDSWLAYTGYGGLPVADRRPGEAWIDWRARMSQQGPGERAPDKNRRTTAWKQANPDVPAGAAAGPAIPVETIPAFSTNAVSVTAKVADTAQCKRIKIAYHLFRVPNVGHAAMVKNVRRRTFKWVRRVYAQALLSPKIVLIDPPLSRPDSLDAPVPNMISIYNYVGSLARADSPTLPLCSGRTSAGQPSKITLVLEDIEPTVERTIEVVLWPNDPAPPTGVTPLQMGAAIVTAVNDPGTGFGFHADLEAVPKSDLPHEQGCDIFITKGGRARRILRVSDDDVGLNRPPPAEPVDLSVNGKSAVEKRLLQVPGLELVPPLLRIPAAGVEFKLGDNNDLTGGEPTHRRVLRMGRPGEDIGGAQALAAAPQDDRIDIYVVPHFALAGRAYPDYAATADAVSQGVDISDPLFLPAIPIRNAAIVAYQCGAYKVMDGADGSPFTLAHEIGHVLSRGGHNEAQGDLMAGRWPKKPEDSGLTDTPDTNGVRAAKRIYGAPLLVGSEALRNNQDGTTHLRHFPRDMCRDMRERAPRLLENW